MSIELQLIPPQEDAIPLLALTKQSLPDWLSLQAPAFCDWVATHGFAAESGSVLTLPGDQGRLALALFGWDPSDMWSWGHLPAKLPQGCYRIRTELTPSQQEDAALVWGLACYQFKECKTKPKAAPAKPMLCWPEQADRPKILRLIEATHLARNLINRPANLLGPSQLAEEAMGLARRFGADCKVIVGDALLDENYPAIHAVGRAAADAPRLIDLRWGDPSFRKLTLVGKGVCFDSGGLDLKSSTSMKLMKKDMGGAAIALALAQAIMDADLKLSLRLLIPAVENAVAGNAFRPLDVIPTRKGITVEVGNTDAEGRLILADALFEADREMPELLLDFATLTGAARVALGPDLPALFSPDDTLALQILAAGEREQDPLWRLPLWAPYRRLLDSKIADINSTGDSSYSGAITAALFLQEFVAKQRAWAHLDVYCWNSATRPGRPEGGEAMGLRAIYSVITQRFAV